MTFSQGLSTFLKLRRIVAIVSVLTGAGTYKYGPAVWHKVEAKTGAKTQVKADAKGGLTTDASTVSHDGITTNTAGIKLSNCNLGTVMLTNHSETCVVLGPGQDCVLTPNMIDSHNLQLTVTVESKKPNGRIHDLSITQVVAKAGESFEVAVGDYNFSLTPNVKVE
jgi:hypothetical protein